MVSLNPIMLFNMDKGGGSLHKYVTNYWLQFHTTTARNPEIRFCTW